MCPPPRVASAASTGGAGTTFEQQTKAYFLALLLNRAIPPILQDCTVAEVRSQSSYLGYATDDLLVTGRRADAATRRLIVQVKRAMTISASDEECEATFAGFWKDYNNPQLFTQGQDCCVLVLQRPTGVIVDGLGTLLECARAAVSSSDFVARLGVPGFVSQVAIRHRDAIKAIVSPESENTFDEESFWNFLKAVHLLSLDLGTSTAQAEASIKNLLALTVTESDAVSGAATSWNALLSLADSTGVAGAYTYELLPEALRRRHTGIPDAISRSIANLIDHTKTVLGRTVTRIAGKVHVERPTLLAQVLASTNNNQITVITGRAGLGKSALAKDLASVISNTGMVLAFRAEEFAEVSLDKTFASAGSVPSASAVLSALAGQSSLTCLIEGVERLLEARDRDALLQFLQLVSANKSIKVVLTCRDYSVDTIVSAFLEQVPVPKTIVRIEPFTDDELNLVVNVIPTLSHPLSSPRLRELLRSPYLLDKAGRMNWDLHQELPASERAFREKCWADVIRLDSERTNAMPRRREQAFIDLCVKRARQLSPFVSFAELDGEAISLLERDGLITVLGQGSSAAAPSHDVLEDWAIVTWLWARFDELGQQHRPMQEVIGGFPALRRALRKWLGEMLEGDALVADRFALSTMDDQAIASYFRDDVLTAVLQSPGAAQFLERQGTALGIDDNALLVRIIHLLRVSCMTAPTAIPAGFTLSSQWLRPIGSAWGATMEVVGSRAAQLPAEKHGLLLGFLEDWARQVEWNAPDPSGFAGAGQLAFHLLSGLRGYGVEEQRKRLIEVILKIPRASPVEFTKLLARVGSRDPADPTANALGEAIMSGVTVGIACRDFPNEVKDAVLRRVCQEDPGERGASAISGLIGYTPHYEVDEAFGLRAHISHQSFPPSAIRGPFLPLLRFNAPIGVELLLSLWNHAGRWYGEQLSFQLKLEQPNRIKLAWEGGSVEQWSSSRIWYAYRGTSVVPTVLQSASMALERFLFEIKDYDKQLLEPILLRLLKDSNNTAIAGIVASFCVAHPKKCGRAGLALLSSRELIEIDFARAVSDRGSFGADCMSALLPGGEFFAKERKEFDRLPHRGKSLEDLAIAFQLGAEKDAVLSIIDTYREQLPEESARTVADQDWEVALQRMDLRTYQVVEPPADANVPDAPDGSRMVYLMPSPPSRTTQERIEAARESLRQQTDQLNLWSLGTKAWEEGLSSQPSRPWRELLDLARPHIDNGIPVTEMGEASPTLIVAAIVRDKWDELGEAERVWSIRHLCSVLSDNEDSSQSPTEWSSGKGESAAAIALARTLNKQNVGIDQDALFLVIAGALRHPNRDVRAETALALGMASQGELSWIRAHCIAALVRAGDRLHQALLEAQSRERPRFASVDTQEIEAELSPLFFEDLQRIPRLESGQSIPPIDLESWPGRDAARLAILLIKHQPLDSAGKQVVKAVVKHIVGNWGVRRREIEDVEFPIDSLSQVAFMLLRAPTREALELIEPVLSAIREHPDDAADVLQALLRHEDGGPTPSSFWGVWKAFADSLLSQPWTAGIENDHSFGEKLLAAVFLVTRWKEGVDEWSRLDGHWKEVDHVASSLPPSAPLVRDYTRYLYNIGKSSLPQGFVILSDIVRGATHQEPFAKGETVYCLEVLLRKYVYAEPGRLRSDRRLKEALMELLDLLVDAGSSSAFLIRDDFVTPMT